MKRFCACVIAGYLSVSMSAFAEFGTTVSIGEFSYIDTTEKVSVDTGRDRFNEMEFEFLLAETLSAMTKISVVEEHLATFRVVGRVTKLNTAGAARVEIAFLTRDQLSRPLDDIEDLVVIETNLTDEVDAMLGLVEQARAIVANRLAPKYEFEIVETIATR